MTHRPAGDLWHVCRTFPMALPGHAHFNATNEICPYYHNNIRRYQISINPQMYHD